jgi:hypothetical protein
MPQHMYVVASALSAVMLLQRHLLQP